MYLNGMLNAKRSPKMKVTFIGSVIETFFSALSRTIVCKYLMNVDSNLLVDNNCSA